MPLDIFTGAQREADAFTSTQPGWGPGLEATPDEAFLAAARAVGGTWRKLRVDMEESGVVQDWAATFEKSAGYAPIQPDFRRPTASQYAELRKAYDAEKLKRPDLDIPEPPTQEMAHAAAIDAERKILGINAAIQARPQTFASRAGSVLGGIAGVAVDPINLASMAAGGPASGILTTALRDAAIVGVSQAAISVSGLKLSREVDPNYGLGDVASEVGQAAIGGAVLGGGIRALAKAWTRLSGRGTHLPPPPETPLPPLPESVTAVPDITLPETVVQAEFPRDVIDAGNVVTREAAIADANPHRGAGPEGEVIHSQNYQAAEKAITEGKPVEIAPFSPRPSEVIDSSGRKVGVKYEVVEASDLIASHNPDLGINPAYPAELQPRDRTRAVSADQITGIASRLEPSLLGPSADAAHGAPIVGPDNVVESGNGRVLAIKQAYGAVAAAPERIEGAAVRIEGEIFRGQTHAEALDRASGKLGIPYETLVDRYGPEGSDVNGFLTSQGRFVSRKEATAIDTASRLPSRSDAYRRFLSEQGFNVDGMTMPVLIARRTTPLEGADRAAFADAANRATTLRMSAPEQAMADGRLIDAPLLDKLTGGITSTEAKPFVRAFIGKLPKEERGGLIDREGNLSLEGQRRVEAALLARAYGDPVLLAKILESTDSNVKALAGSLTDVSGRWTAMRDAVARGDVAAGMDITKDLLDAFRLVGKARDEGVKLKMLVDQAEMFDAPTSTTRALLRLMFRNEDLTQAASRQAVARGLDGFAEEALKNTPDANLFGEAPLAAGDVLSAALKKAGREDLAVPAEQATLPLAARKMLADPNVDDASIHQLEHLQEQAPDLMVADPAGTLNADGTPVKVSVKSLIDQADAEINAAQEIGDCAIGKMTPAAA